MNKTVLIALSLMAITASAQTMTVKGYVGDLTTNSPIQGVTIAVVGLAKATFTDSSGFYVLSLPKTSHKLRISALGYLTEQQEVASSDSLVHNFLLEPTTFQLNEVVISGTMKELSKAESPVTVEVISSKFLQKNPSSNLFDALRHINGVRPQVNCNVCGTGDIRINGLNGAYTMVLIDGMPLVSALGTVYGLSGIPPSLIERIELVKGPASTLYGSEAIGGVLNIITKSPLKTPTFSADISSSTWGEITADIGLKSVIKNVHTLLGINAFSYQNPKDINLDGFTDISLQNRVSIFNKWYVKTKANRVNNWAIRGLYEDRWGGQTNWTWADEGSSSVYGESIKTKRLEVLGTQEITENLTFRFSYNIHTQNSYYGTTHYKALQQIGFSQIAYNKVFVKHDVLLGLPIRYTYYDDNTPATMLRDGEKNQPSKVVLPGIFIQDEWQLPSHQRLLTGFRLDYHPAHGTIITPRIAYKISSSNALRVVRFNLGRGYRVVNLFTEDHAALTGARQVVVAEALKPEQSWNVNASFTQNFIFKKGFLSLDGSAFYSYFTNQILPNYDQNPNQIIYNNLNGFAVSKGLSLAIEANFDNGLRFQAGGTLMDVSKWEKDIRSSQLLTERFSGTWSISYELHRFGLDIDYTGNLTGPIQLPLLSPTDPRPAFSPMWSLQNIQFTKHIKNKWEVYVGIKNLLNFSPANKVPFLIARANDPFDKQVEFDMAGQVIATPNNPYALTFDPTYSYAPLQGRRFLVGVRWEIK